MDGPIQEDQRMAAGHGCIQWAPWQSLAGGKAVDFLEAKGEKGKGFSLFLQARMELLDGGDHPFKK